MKPQFKLIFIAILCFSNYIKSAKIELGVCENAVDNYVKCIQCVFNALPRVTSKEKRILSYICSKLKSLNIRDNTTHYHEVDGNYEHWMQRLSPKLQNTSINLIAIPGSHDSGTYSISSSSKLDPSAEEVFRILNKLFGKLARIVMTKWSITQDLNFQLQLQAGVRYFDMRISKNIYDNNEFYFVHSLYANQVKQEFDVIKTFLLSHPKEVILLDFNHFYNMNTNDHRNFVQMIKNEFKNLLIPFTPKVPTIKEIWSSKRQVIAFYHTQGNHSDLWPGFMIPSPWANSVDTDYLIKYLNETYHSKRLPELNLFYVSQGVLTPDESTIVKNLFSSLKKSLSNKASKAFLDWLDTVSIAEEKINVSIVDFVENFGYIKKILSLNN